jgi:hypothetical protein
MNLDHTCPSLENVSAAAITRDAVVSHSHHLPSDNDSHYFSREAVVSSLPVLLDRHLSLVMEPSTFLLPNESALML